MQMPPPDLAVEIDITSSSLNRLVIYQALGVPEVWRYDGTQLDICCLIGGEYVSQPRSQAIPLLGSTDLVRFLKASQTMGENALVKQFRQWVRQQMEA